MRLPKLWVELEDPEGEKRAIEIKKILN